ncbi:hypothetical protein I6J71_14120 [Amycolatopsis sp. FDAARGOS 1241]|nr:hypothetical protein I6J71_14120 [Amycolatopsis sp. FDAARGOS 1241]
MVLNHDESSVMDAVLATLENTTDEQAEVVLSDLGRSAHDFAREVDLTEADWAAAPGFLAWTDQICTPRLRSSSSSPMSSESPFSSTPPTIHVVRRRRRTASSDSFTRTVGRCAYGAVISAGCPGRRCCSMRWSSTGRRTCPRCSVRRLARCGIGLLRLGLSSA